MCGIAGAWQGEGQQRRSEEAARDMIERLVHRGPDDRGVWADPDRDLALGHRRLSILDLSSRGRQPMHSPDGRWTLVFNGEVYNFRRLRERLCGKWRFETETDSEVFLAAAATWGVERACRESVGMFALAVWDHDARSLWLARDRVGKKPLYYAQVGSGLYFASELHALRAGAGSTFAVDRRALGGFLRHRAVQGENSILAGVRRLLPGHLVRFRDPVEPPRRTRYWSLDRVAVEGTRDLLSEPDSYLRQLEDTLRDAVDLRMIADVPIGVFLSGGVDSSLIAAMMQESSSRPVRSFSIGFEDGRFDEAPFARAVAESIGTQHIEHRFTHDDALAVIPRMGTVFDEPFADVAQLPALLLAEICRRDVTVCLSGDGGDELFAGYAQHRRFARWMRGLRRAPRCARRAVARAIDGSGAALSKWPRWRARAEFVRQMLQSTGRADVYRHLVSHWRAGSPLLDPVEPLSSSGCDEDLRGLDDIAFAGLMDQGSYLPDDILVKVDRTTMAVALEARAPLLDHRVVELSWRCPSQLKLLDGRGKWPLRELLYKRVPRALVDRPKAGFDVPVGAWLRGPLRTWADDLLSERTLLRDGFFEVPYVQRVWQEHRRGTADHTQDIWSLLMFQTWLHHGPAFETAGAPGQVACPPSRRGRRAVAGRDVA